MFASASSIRLLVPGALALGLLAAPLGAQRVSTQSGPVTAPLVEVVPYVGYLVSGSLFDGPLGTSIGTAGGPLYGAQLGVPLMPGVSLYGNIGYARADLQVGLPLLGGISVGRSERWLYDGGLQLGTALRSVNGRSLAPFVQIGAGGMRYTIDVSSVGTHATSFAPNVGAGLDLTLTPNVGVRLMGKDYVAKFDMKEATSLNVDTKTTHNWALTAGVKIGF